MSVLGFFCELDIKKQDDVSEKIMNLQQFSSD